MFLLDFFFFWLVHTGSFHVRIVTVILWCDKNKCCDKSTIGGAEIESLLVFECQDFHTAGAVVR